MSRCILQVGRVPNLYLPHFLVDGRNVMLLLLLNCRKTRRCSDSITAGAAGGITMVVALAALLISSVSVVILG